MIEVGDPELQTVRDALLLRDFAFFPAASYSELEEFEQAAMAAGYRELPAPLRSPLTDSWATSTTRAHRSRKRNELRGLADRGARCVRAKSPVRAAQPMGAATYGLLPTVMVV